MAIRLLTFALLLLVPATSALAQSEPPNRAGVSLSHLNFVVADLEANRAFWIALGGTPVPGRGPDVIGFPGVMIVLTQGPARPAGGSVIAHMAFRVKTFAQVEAKGLHVERRRIEGRESGGVVSPAGDPVELFEENAEQNRFRADGAHADGSNRHNEPLTTPIISHHLHLNVPMGQDVKAQQWYASLFGGVTGIRLRYPATDVPGINFNFSGVANATAPSTTRTIDHVGFQVRSLAEFAQRLSAAGITAERRERDEWSGRPALRFVDPWGTAIEVVEAR